MTDPNPEDLTIEEEGNLNEANTAEAPTRKTSRRLRPEVAAAFAARNRELRLQEFYQKPVEQLEPEELAIMRAAFFKR